MAVPLRVDLISSVSFSLTPADRNVSVRLAQRMPRFGASLEQGPLSWAFFVAGCPTTVVSQWKVDSASTAELMIAFHKHLASDFHGQERPWTKADALRRAMMTVMKYPK